LLFQRERAKKLEDCENIAARINARTNKNDLLHTLHTLVYGGRPNKKTPVKENLLSFKGIVYEEGKDSDYWEQRLARFKKNPLRDIAAFFGEDPKGDREDLVKRILAFLEKPADSDAKYPISDESKKRRRSRSRSSSPARRTKKAKKDPNHPKRNKSSYMFFVKDNQKKLAQEHPSEKVTEIAVRLGKMWKKMDSSDKEKYDKLAKKDQKRYKEEMEKYKGK